MAYPKELISCFSDAKWKGLSSFAARLNALQNVENYLAALQGRPAKQIHPRRLEGSVYGAWSKRENAIIINESLLRNDTFEYVSKDTGQLVQSYRPDSALQLFDTIAHEGFHAYQDFCIEHPDICPDPAMLEQWMVNRAESPDLKERNYIDPRSGIPGATEYYRTQPLERDASDYGNRMTLLAATEIGMTQENSPAFESYIDNIERNSYQIAEQNLKNNNLPAPKEMYQQMVDRAQIWYLQYQADIANNASRFPNLTNGPQDLRPPVPGNNPSSNPPNHNDSGDPPMKLKRTITTEILQGRSTDTESVLENYRENLRGLGVTNETAIESFIAQERQKINLEFESLDHGDLESNKYHTPLPEEWASIAATMKDEMLSVSPEHEVSAEMNLSAPIESSLEQNYSPPQESSVELDNAPQRESSLELDNVPQQTSSAEQNNAPSQNNTVVQENIPEQEYDYYIGYGY